MVTVTNRHITILLNTLVILIFIDLVATITWVTAGIAEEANPLMEYLLNQSPLLFAGVKILLSFTGIIVLYNFRKKFRKTIYYVCLGLTGVYMLLALHHLRGFMLLFQ